MTLNRRKIFFCIIGLASICFSLPEANAITIKNNCYLPAWGDTTNFHIYNRSAKPWLNSCDFWERVGKNGGIKENINAQSCFDKGWTKAYVEAEGTVVGAEFSKNSASIECNMNGLICTCHTKHQ